MSNPDQSLLTRLKSAAMACQLTGLGCSVTELNGTVELSRENSQLQLDLELGIPVAGVADSVRHDLAAVLAPLQDDSMQLVINVRSAVVAANSNSSAQSLPGVKNIIAIASGKGGVGKSATAVNLALALRAEGARVGLLDADIYGPSQPAMLGVPAQTRPEIIDQKIFVPVLAHGLQTMSMGYMVTEKTPMVWRGPMVSGALMQMLNQTNWQELDYLLIDMPPGTGDIQLTLSQQVPCTGSVIVTTPQNIALLDARKGIEMFQKVGIPCFGVVENMATHICSNCGLEEHIFGAGGGAQIAGEYAVPLLGSLPLDPIIREGLDVGQPIVVAQPDSVIARQYIAIARQLAIAVCRASGQAAGGAAPSIIISDD